jgi:hypothetical protein
VPFTFAPQPGRQILKLEGKVTVAHAQNLAAELRDSLDERTPVEVDTEGLEDIDTAILQLLCALRKTAPALAFPRPSEMFLGAADRCGLRRELLGGSEAW